MLSPTQLVATIKSNADFVLEVIEQANAESSVIPPGAQLEITRIYLHSLIEFQDVDGVKKLITEYTEKVHNVCKVEKDSEDLLKEVKAMCKAALARKDRKPEESEEDAEDMNQVPGRNIDAPEASITELPEPVHDDCKFEQDAKEQLKEVAKGLGDARGPEEPDEDSERTNIHQANNLSGAQEESSPSRGRQVPVRSVSEL
ncbi:hypothetical protein B0H11DRAFT_1988550 [Mycena galericulata]|nr:hypothetical protein B0H11DRAFT_1988550 [Mycena galericulata]